LGQLMFRQSFFDRLTTLDILQNLELLLWGKNPPHLPYLLLLFHVVPFPPWNDMEEKQEVRKVRRIFTPEQKFEILKDIQRCATIKEGLAKHQLAQSLYQKWKRQLEVGVRASLRNRRPLKTADLKRLEAENRKLKEVVLNQALLISE